MKKVFIGASFGILALIMTVLPVLAAYIFTFTVTNGGATSFTSEPVIVAMNNNDMVTNGYITASGLDVKVFQGATEIPHMLSWNGTSIVGSMAANTATTFQYTTGNTLATSTQIIPGKGGYVTIPNNSAFNIVTSNFSVDWSGYLDSSHTGSIWNKPNSSIIQVNSTNLTATIYVYTLTDYTINVNSWGASKRDSVVETYNSCWTSVNGTSNYGNASMMYRALSSSWLITRPYLRFDTSGIVNPIYSGKIYIYNGGSNVDNNYDIVVQSGNNTYPHNPAVLPDYNKSNYSGNGGSVSGHWFNTHTSANITLNTSGLGMVNLGGMTTFVLRNSDDIAGSASGANDMDIESGGNDKLYLTTYSGLTAVTLNTPKVSGVHTVTLSNASGTLGLYVDGVLKDSAAITGKLIQDSVDDIVALQSDVTPYTTYLKYSVSGVEKFKGQPNGIIQAGTYGGLNGGVLTDLDGTQDGLIVYGTNSPYLIPGPPSLGGGGGGGGGSGGGAQAPPYTPGPPGGQLFPPPTATGTFGTGNLLYLVIALIVIEATSILTSALMARLGNSGASLFIKTGVITGLMGIFIAIPAVSGTPGGWVDFWMLIFFLCMAIAIMMGADPYQRMR